MPGEVLLKHGNMGEKSDIIEIFSPMGTFSDTGLAFYADACDDRRISCGNGTHGAFLCAKPA